MNQTTEHYISKLQGILGDYLQSLLISYGEINMVASAENYLPLMDLLCKHSDLQFTQLIDLCAVDYLTYGEGLYEREEVDKRFAVVCHLLSMSNNLRVRVKVYLKDNEVPIIDSVTKIWPVAEWFEREAFDLFGIVFDGNEDLRRILTDYGFIGHPFRKDFPISGNTEIVYNNEQHRIVQQAVSIVPRENIPRTVRPVGFAKN